MNISKYIIWGYKNYYDTHGHIHEGFYHALKGSGKEVLWLDQCDDISGIDFANSFIITNHCCIPANPDYWPWPKERKSVLPIRDDCFYAVHGLHDHPAVHELFSDHKYNLAWNVLAMRAMRDKLNLPNYSVLEDEIYLDEDVPFSPGKRYMEFRWATNLLPAEIEANKPDTLLHLKKRIINWVGTVWWVNERELREFKRACEEDLVMFKASGAGQKGVVSADDNVTLIRESWMAPAISGSHHLTEGYVPCRAFKNVSYGQMIMTNNAKTWELFNRSIIYNPDPYKLYWQAKEQLQDITLQDLHRQMDFVAQKHTYLNRLAVLEQAAQIIIQ